jgi:uncharacterized membrane protein YeaQ/YmgE (transglycosylase-associated protein family)
MAVVIGVLISYVVIGFLAGAVARFLVPGRDPMGCLGTIVLGVVGSFLGGFIWELIQFHRLELRPIGFIGSVLGAIVVLLFRRVVSQR